MDIREVIRNAREVTSLPGVLIERVELIRSLGDRLDINAEQVIDNLCCQFPEGFKVVSVLPTVLDVVAKKIGKPVVIREMDVGETDIQVYGYIENSEKDAVIRVRPGMNTCWKRFTVLKELMHLYSNTCDDSIGESASLIAMAARRSRDVVAKDNSILCHEEAAFYMALEILIPWCDGRKQLLRLRDLGATHYQIAKVFMLPTPIVTHFLGDDEETPYIGLSLRLNQNI